MFARLFGSPRATRFYFDRIGLPYRWMTNNPLWRESLREMSRHFPPGGAELKVLDLGCGPGNSALQLLEYRPDLRILGIDFSIGILSFAQRASLKAKRQDQTAWVQGDATCLPVPDNSFVAVTAHSVYYMIADWPAFLREALRVLRPGGRLILLNPIERPYPLRLLLNAWRSRSAISLLTWHAVSRMHDRFGVEQMAEHLTAAGFARVLSERAVEGYGVLSRGEKPYPNLSTIERIAQTAALDETGTPGGFQPITAVVNDSPGKPYLLAFTSLSKAVAFMQPAVTSGYLVGINKVAKFDKVIAPHWAVDLLLNPPFEDLHTSDRLRFNGNYLTVDPSHAVIGEE